MNDVDTTQRQIQEQKVKLHGAGPTHWIGEVLKYGLFFFLVVVGVMVFVWVFGGQNGQYTDLGILFVLAAFSLWCLFHGGRWVMHKASKAELDTHFHDVSPVLTVGDTRTHDFTPFYVPQFQEVKDQYTEEEDTPRVPEISPYATSLLTMSQQREKQIQTYYYEQGKTMNDIVKTMAHSSIFDPPSLYDVRVALGKTGKEVKNDEH